MGNSVGRVAAACAALLAVAVQSVVNAAPARAIVGGTAAASGAYPFMASLRLNGDPFCGGTLIAAQWVLTAAHCVDNHTAAQLTAVIDQVDVSGNAGQSMQADRIVVSPAFDPTTEASDVALVHLTQPVAAITPALLIPSGDTADTAPGTVATVIGFGSTDPQPANGGGQVAYPTALQQANVALVSDQQCAQVFNGRSEPALSSDVMLCAGGDGKHDACVGDSGGPLLIPGASAGTWLDIAITSWGAGCAVHGIPGVYARLSDPAIASFIATTVGG